MFNKIAIEKQFAKMGARVIVRKVEANTHFIDIKTDKYGEFFDIALNPDFNHEIQVINVDPNDRHLVALIKDPNGKERFLCGHDERSWFVAAVPKAVSTVWEAKESLKPPEVRQSQDSNKVKKQKRNKRNNKGYLRQGEWFFIPCPNFDFEDNVILKNEPLRRGRGKPHMVEEVIRRGGENVYVSFEYPDGITEEKYKSLITKNPHMKNANWRLMRRNATVYCRGKVSHPDHKTIELTFWHRVIPNTESNAPWMRNMAFLD